MERPNNWMCCQISGTQLLTRKLQHGWQCTVTRATPPNCTNIYK